MSTVKYIYPNKKLGQQILELLARPSIPVSRFLIDKQLNRKNDPNVKSSISDTLMWLHLMDRIHRQFKNTGEEGVTETTVYFWLSDREYDGYVDAPKQFDKYRIEFSTTKISQEEQPPKAEEVVAPVATPAPAPAPTAAPAVEATPAPAPRSASLADADRNPPKPRDTRTVDQIVYANAVANEPFTLAAACAWCGKETATDRIVAMRLGNMSRHGQLLKSDDGKHFALPGGQYPAWFNPLPASTDTSYKRRSKTAQPVAAPTVSSAQLLSKAQEIAKQMTDLDQTRTIVLDGNAEMSLGSNGTLLIKGVDAEGNQANPVLLQGKAFLALLRFTKNLSPENFEPFAD